MLPVPAFLRSIPRRFRGAAPLLGLVAVVALSACSDELDARGGCPILCPESPDRARDTTVVLTSANLAVTNIPGFPARGIEGWLFLAQVSDPAGNLDARAVIRFDTLVTQYQIGTDSLRPITALDSAFLHLSIDSVGTRATAPVTLEVYDLNRDGETGDDEAALGPAFRAERLLGSRTIPVDSLRDTVRVPLDRAVIQARVSANRRLRVGLQVRSTGNAVVRLRATNGGFIHQLSYRPTPDSGANRIFNSPDSKDPPSLPFVSSAFADYNLVFSAPALAGANEIRVGGVNGYRSLLRFTLPGGLVDSVGIVRATLEFRRVPTSGFLGGDSLELRPFIPIASSVITDSSRVAELFAPWGLAGLYGPRSFTERQRVLAADTGVVSIEIGGLLREWQRRGTSFPRALLLTVNEEGTAAGVLRLGAGAAIQPRLVITYAPRPGQGLP